MLHIYNEFRVCVKVIYILMNVKIDVVSLFLFLVKSCSYLDKCHVGNLIGLTMTNY